MMLQNLRRDFYGLNSLESNGLRALRKFSKT